MSFWRRKPKTQARQPVISGPLGTDFLVHGQSGGIKDVKRVVLAGHGSFNTITDARYPKVRLPPSVTIWFWCLHGEALDDAVGAYIESHADLNDLPEYMMQRVRDGGNATAIPEIVKGGSEIWNYRLTYPSGLNLGNKPANVPSSVYNRPVTPASPAKMPTGAVGDRRYLIVPPLSGDVKDRGVPIIALLAGHWNKCDGAIIHWCACRSVANR